MTGRAGVVASSHVLFREVVVDHDGLEKMGTEEDALALDWSGGQRS